MAEQKAAQASPKVETKKLDIEKLKELKIAELNKIARDLQVNGVAGLKKQDRRHDYRTLPHCQRRTCLLHDI